MTARAGLLTLSLGLAGALPVGAAPAAPPTDITVTPPEILQGLNYRGADITVIAAAPAGRELVLRCLGPKRDVHLRRKGRVWGLWMNVGNLVFEKVPTLCLTATLPKTPRDGEAGSSGRELSCRNAAETPEGELFSQFIKLKESAGLYSKRAGEIRMVGRAQDGRVTVHASFRLPAKALPAEYSVELFAREGGRFVLLGKGGFAVKISGLPARLTRLLERHPLAYGCFAVLLACVAGLAVGMIFSKAGH